MGLSHSACVKDLELQALQPGPRIPIKKPNFEKCGLLFSLRKESLSLSTVNSQNGLSLSIVPSDAAMLTEC